MMTFNVNVIGSPTKAKRRLHFYDNLTRIQQNVAAVATHYSALILLCSRRCQATNVARNRVAESGQFAKKYGVRWWLCHRKHESHSVCVQRRVRRWSFVNVVGSPTLLALSDSKVTRKPLPLSRLCHCHRGAAHRVAGAIENCTPSRPMRCGIRGSGNRASCRDGAACECVFPRNDTARVGADSLGRCTWHGDTHIQRRW